MAEPLRKPQWHEEPTSPISAGTEPLPPSLPGTPPAFDEEQGRRMEKDARGRSIGEAVGTALGSLGAKVRTGLSAVGGKTREAGTQLDDVTDAARERAEQLGEEARIRFNRIRGAAQQKLYEVRSNAKRAARENPVQTIALIAGAAFVIGFVLRIWRANSD